MKPILYLPLTLALICPTWAKCDDDYDSGYDSSASSYGYGYNYGREESEAPTSYISNGPMVMPLYGKESAIAIGSGSGSNFIGQTITTRGHSCNSAYGITTCD